MATSEVIWDSTPVPEKWIKTKCFHVTHSNGGTQLYLSHIQSHFLDLDFIIDRVCHESKSVPTSSQFNFAAKESQLTGVMWYKETPGQQDKRTTDNKGFTARKK
jgi:hypothetical protein